LRVLARHGLWFGFRGEGGRLMMRLRRARPSGFCDDL
jgi:hypothetical protein